MWRGANREITKAVSLLKLVEILLSPLEIVETEVERYYMFVVTMS